MSATLVARDLVHGMTERIDCEGDVVVQLNEAEVAQAIEHLMAAGVEAIAVVLLWSFMNPAHEQRIKAIIGLGDLVTGSIKRVFDQAGVAPGEIPVVGWGNSLDTTQEVMEGYVNAAQWQDPQATSYMALSLAAMAASDIPPGFDITVGTLYEKDAAPIYDEMVARAAVGVVGGKIVMATVFVTVILGLFAAARARSEHMHEWSELPSPLRRLLLQSHRTTREMSLSSDIGLRSMDRSPIRDMKDLLERMRDRGAAIDAGLAEKQRTKEEADKKPT